MDAKEGTLIGEDEEEELELVLKKEVELGLEVEEEDELPTGSPALRVNSTEGTTTTVATIKTMTTTPTVVRIAWCPGLSIAGVGGHSIH
jgi:hypothetical protein